MRGHYIKCNLFFYFYLKRGVDYYVASSGKSTQLTGLKITYVPGGSTQSPIKGNQHKTPTCWISAHETYQTRGGRCRHSVPWRIFRKPRIRSWFFWKRNSRWLPSYWKQIIFKINFQPNWSTRFRDQLSRTDFDFSVQCPIPSANYCLIATWFWTNFGCLLYWRFACKWNYCSFSV